jgi:hypothetical protein
VRQWKDRIRAWAENPAVDDNHDTWDQFLVQFKAQYADTQKSERARTTIETIALKNNDIDQFISDFIDLATEAEYHLEAEGTKRIFLKALPRFIGLETTRRLPNNYGWAQLIAAAIGAVGWAKSINNMWGPQKNTQSNRTSSNNWRQNTGPPPKPAPPTQWRNNQPNNQRFNSSNAPPWMNNQPVPMDVSRTRGRAQNNVAQSASNVAQSTRPPRPLGPCFNCNELGHLKRNCPNPQRAKVAEAQSYDLMSDAQTLVDWTPQAPDPVANVMQLLQTMTDADRARMQREMGDDSEQDFRSV